MAFYSIIAIFFGFFLLVWLVLRGAIKEGLATTDMPALFLIKK